MGAHARDNFLKYLDKPLETILTTEENKVPLIKKSFFSYTDNTNAIHIPVYIIEHPSAWNGLNNEQNVSRKRDAFKKILTNTIL